MKKFAICLITIFIVWFLGFFYFLKITEETPLINRFVTDAIIVVNPKKQNLNTAIQLLKVGYAPFIYIIGSNDKHEFNNFFKEYKIAPEQLVFSSQFNIDEENINYAIYAFLTKFKFKSFRLVGSAVEMPAIMVELRQTFPKDIIIIPHVINNNKKFGTSMQEYIKYTCALILSFLGHPNELAISYS